MRMYMVDEGVYGMATQVASSYVFLFFLYDVSMTTHNRRTDSKGAHAMDYQQIRAFLAIVDTNSVSKAAELLFVTQSSISKKLKSLEDELGTRLIYREKGLRRIHLTPDGERFYPLAVEYKNTNQRLEQFCEGEARSSLRVAGVDSLNSSVLAPLYPELLRRCPGLELTITTNQTSYIYEMVNRQDFDLGFVLSEYRWPNVVVEPFIRQRFNLVICSDAPLDENRVYSPEQLDPTLEVFQPWGSVYQRWHEYWWPTNGYYIKVDTVSLASEALFKENYWSIVPDSVAALYRGNPKFHIFELSPAPPERQCYLIRNRYPQNSCIRAIAEFKEILAELQEEYGSRPL